jgi:tetratricopeptide (TPR) repeat protein
MSQVTIQQALQIGINHHKAGRLAQAESVYRQIIQLDPNNVNTLHMLGVVQTQTGRVADGIVLIRRAIALRPDWPEALGNLGVALTAAGQPQEAILCHRRELALSPSSATAMCNLGSALRAAGQVEEAIASHRRAIAIQTEFAEAHHNLGSALRDQDKLEEAIDSFRRALALRSSYADCHNSLGATLRGIGCYEDAIASFHRAIQLRPDHADAHFNLALALLLLGDFEAGWREYEWRWRLPKAPKSEKNLHQPRWDGSDLTGRTILLSSEQGIGDTIQFMRYVPLVVARGGQVLLDIQPELHRLIDKGNLQGASLMSDASAAFDVQLPLMSLPMVLGEFDFASPTIPKPPYIQPDPALRQKWRGLLGNEDKFKVGLAWAGRPTHVNDRQRSMSLADFAPLASEQIHFYSLQFGPAAAQVATPPPGMKLTDLTGQIEDFADTAPLIAELDLVICVDTAIAHLAGAMNRPIWLLLPFAPDFRWLLNRDDSLWYPSMRLFRQTRRGEWAGPMQRAAAALSQSI